MSTRGAWGFRIGGVDKLMYSRSDSYPEYLGDILVKFLKRANMRKIRRIAERIVLVPEDADLKALIPDLTKQIPGAIIKSEDDAHHRITAPSHDPWMYLGTELSYMIDSSRFMSDSLFCEHAYIINLDSAELEYYRGYNKNPKANGRYADCRPDDGFYGVRLIACYPLPLKGRATVIVKDMIQKSRLIDAISET